MLNVIYSNTSVTYNQIYVFPLTNIKDKTRLAKNLVMAA